MPGTAVELRSRRETHCRDATPQHGAVLELSNGQLYGWLTSAVDYFAVQQATFGLRADGPTRWCDLH